MSKRSAKAKTVVFVIALTLLLIGAYGFGQATFAAGDGGRSFKLDTTPPIINVTAPKANRYIRGVVRIRVSSIDPSGGAAASGLSGVKAYIGRKVLAQTAAGTATLRLDTRKITQGRRWLKVVARDNAGHSTIFYRRYFVDNNKPRIPVAYFSPALPVVDDHAQLTFKVRDRTAPEINVKVQLRRASGTLFSEAALGWVKRETPRSVSLKMPALEGEYIRRIIAVDKAGNRRINDRAFRVGNYWQLDKVKSHIFELSKNIGVRVEGTDGEHRAADYIEGKLQSYGYAVERQSFALPDGKISYNIVARRAGSDAAKQFIVGAHYDSKSPSPGANDNGTGAGVVLELARLFKTKQSKPTMVFALFGSEERFGVNRYPEHQGSRHFVETMSAEARRNTLGMISVDMVGVGSTFWVRSMRKGTMSLVNDLLAFAKADGTAIGYAQDFGWSDHDQFELAGIPAAWLEWRYDNLFHTTGDAYERIQWDAVDITGNFLSKFLMDRLHN
ncbi:MAG: M28 family peptidase [Actinomycetota bacterium]|nr:M28 family peptidase [Actinomycetota bacterium]